MLCDKMRIALLLKEGKSLEGVIQQNRDWVLYHFVLNSVSGAANPK
jgi:hypothetical protein